MSSADQVVPNRTPLYLTFALMMFCFSSISSARVVLSLYALDLGATPSALGLLVATLYVFPLLLSWPIGFFSDRIGSRGLLLAGTLCGACGMLIPFFWRELGALYVAAATVGLAFLSYNVLLQNLVGLLSRPQDYARNFSNASLIGASTNFIGPLAAGFAIDYSGHALTSLYVASLSFVAAMMLAIWGGALPRPAVRTGAGQKKGDMLANKGIVRVLVASGLIQVGQDLFQFYIPIHGVGIGLSSSAIGAILATFAAAAFVVRFGMPRLVARLGENGLLVYSFCLAATGFLLAPFCSNGVALAMVAFVFGLGMGCGQPVTTMMVFSHSAKGRSGETFGLRQTVNNLMRVSGPVLFGFIASAYGLFPVFWINALMMGAGGWISRTRVRKTA